MHDWKFIFDRKLGYTSRIVPLTPVSYKSSVSHLLCPKAASLAHLVFADEDSISILI